MTSTASRQWLRTVVSATSLFIAIVVGCGGSPTDAAPGAAPIGGSCINATDCGSGVCMGGMCGAPNACSDGVQGGSETDVDCGGGACAACANGKKCVSATDCAINMCTSGVCQAETCTDKVKDGTETAVDCGGSDCAPCADGKACGAAKDCTSGVCSVNVCQGATCNDGVKNGSETGIDCDGSCLNCASKLDRTVATNLAAATAFLYSGSHPPQTGVAAGTIDPVRVAVLRGRVLDHGGAALAGVSVSISQHSELGSTLTRGDGTYDVAVNGGGSVVVQFKKTGLLPVQRRVDTPWQDFVVLKDVALTALDSQVTAIDFASPIEVHRANPATDGDGTRQSTLLFAQGTTATMQLPDGTTQPLASIHVRATEFTVGSMGAAAMPGSLPAASHYTHAVDYSIDEAIAAGATKVVFSQPVVDYTENFLGFPVGSPVPLGSYDVIRGTWVPESDGLVVKVLSVGGGSVTLDVDGSGIAASSAKLTALGITSAELASVATLYKAGATLWRTAVPHFSSFDRNWPWSPPAGSPPPGQPPTPGAPPAPDPPQPGAPPTPPKPCDQPGSILEAQSQVLGERIPVAGTPFSLNYRSNRAPGRAGAYTATIPVTGATLPPSLLRVELVMYVVGKTYSANLTAAPNQVQTFVWDGLDAYGRPWQGEATATIIIDYIYDSIYFKPATGGRSFGQLSDTAQPAGVPTPVLPDRKYVSLSQTQQLRLGVLDAGALGLGGWTLSPHHVYAPNTATVFKGDGTQKGDRTQKLVPDQQISHAVIPNIGSNYAGPFAFAPDGTLYHNHTNGNLITALAPDGTSKTFAGNGTSGNGGDGGPALSAQLTIAGCGFGGCMGLAVGPDGSLYIAGGATIRRVRPDGIIERVAGTGTANGAAVATGGAAVATNINPSAVAVASDGTVYFGNSAVYSGCEYALLSVSPDGILHRVAGTPRGVFTCGNAKSGDGGPASLAALTDYSPIPAIRVAADGSILFVDGDRVRRIGPDGVINTVAGGANTSLLNDGGPATLASTSGPFGLALAADGSFFLAHSGPVIRRVSSTGIITPFSGYGSGGDGSLALVASGPGGAIGLSPDGSLYYATTYSAINRISPLYPKFNAQKITVASDDGSEVYLFDSLGRHLSTKSSRGTTLYTFGYDAANLVDTVTDVNGRVTTIKHDAGGNPTAIVAPNGQTTMLTVMANGDLASIADPAADNTAFTYQTGRLLTSLTDARGGVHQVSYDAKGRASKDSNPVGGSTSFSSASAGTSATSTLTSGLGLAASYKIETLPIGSDHRVNTPPTGAIDVVTDKGGTRTVTSPNGMVTTTTDGPDPQWGMAAPLAAKVTIATPSGLVSTTTTSRSVSLTDPKDVFSVSTSKDTIVANGQTSTVSFDKASNTVTLQSAVGRSVVMTLDAKERVVSTQAAPGITPIIHTYDAIGRTTQITNGALSTTIGYDAFDHPVARTDASGAKTKFAYDAAGRVTDWTLPSGNHYAFAYDKNGNRTAITMPNGGTHKLAYDADDAPISYAPPGVMGISTAYDVDGEPTARTIPDGRMITWSYDASGRLITRASSEDTTTIAYVDATSRVKSGAWTPKNGPAQQIAYTYDGALITSIAFSGPTAGSYAFVYDNHLRPTSVTLDANPPTAITYDADGLVTGYGPFTIARGGPAGAASSVTDSALAMSSTYDALARHAGRTHTVASQAIYNTQLAYDLAGRIAQKTETVAGTAHVLAYSYDVDGQLKTVTRDAAAFEAYDYDVNGNRTSRTIGGGAAESATYDSLDRIKSRGGVTYVVDDNGYMTGRGSDTFTYGTGGELLAATVGGATIKYGYDAKGRRVARTGASGTYQFLYGGDSFRVTDARDTSGILTKYYYDDDGGLFAFDRGGVRFYVAADQVGTPRAVVDVSGTVVKTLDYDSFGQLAVDSNPGFDLPIGFAGGLTDAATGLVRYGWRDYEPSSGRWTARDPVLFDGGQANLYVYVGNNPVSVVDPTGLLFFVAANFNIPLLAQSYGLVVDQYGRVSFTNGITAGAPGASLMGGYTNASDANGPQFSVCAGAGGLGGCYGVNPQNGDQTVSFGASTPGITASGTYTQPTGPEDCGPNPNNNVFSAGFWTTPHPIKW